MSKNLVKMNASAGSGKTYTLTDNFVNLLFNSDIAPCESCRPVKNKQRYNFSELLAITFTNLAANQMKEKVIEKLKQYALKEIDCKTKEEQEEKAKQAHAVLETVFRQYGALNIRTIDSLLNQIIGLFALELGYSPHFETSFSSQEYIRELYTQLAELSIENEENQEAGAVNYAPVFHELCRNRFENSKYASFFAKADLQEQVAKFIAYCITNNHVLSREELEELEQNYAFFKQKKEKLEKEILSACARIQNNVEKKEIAVHGNFINALIKAEKGDYSSAYLSKDSFEKVVKANNKGDITDCLKYYTALQKSINEIKLVLPFYTNYVFMLPVIKIAAALYVALDMYEKNQQVINTQKMPYIIAGLLGENQEYLHNAFLLQKKQEENLIPAAYCRLGTRIKHILYDEFQDTSIAQWNALKDLSGEALANGGSVFFVGDVKQAIYGWRGGKASLFNEAPKSLSSIAAHGLKEDNLPYNWRSSQNIVDWNNAFFQMLADEQKCKNVFLCFSPSAQENFSETGIANLVKTVQENYALVEQKIDKTRLPNVQGKGIVEVHSLKESNNFFDVAVLVLLPEMVQNLYKKYHDYSKIAILTVNNKQASQAAQILLEHGIPVVSQGSLGLKEHPVIIEVIAFLRFLANPLDDNAFCQVLLSRHILPRSFYEHCSLKECFDFLVQSRKEACFTAFRDAFPQCWQKYFHALVDGANLLTAYDTLCEVYNRMGIMEQNAEASVYLLRLKELAYLAEERGIVDINAFLSWWEENGDKENAPLPEGLNSVSVLTMHKSKGLEYEAVIIPWHNFRIDVQGDICRLELPFDGQYYTLYAELKKEFGENYEKAIAEKITECINLLYVAWTRAKEELHIFLPEQYDTKKNGNFYPFIKDFLEETKAQLQECITEKGEDGFYLGNEYSPAVGDRTLRVLEYALESALAGKEKLEEYLTKEELKQLALFFEEYKVEKKGKKSDTKESEENTAYELKIPTEDVLYAAKWLSRLLLTPPQGKQKRCPVKKSAVVPEKIFNQEHSMDWLPQLHIFSTKLEELSRQKDLSSNKRGTLVHKSLEYLIFSGNIAEDCKRAGYEAMKFLPYGRFLQHSVHDEMTGNVLQYKDLYAEVQDILRWFASLQEPYGGAEFWFKYGYKEHCITDADGDLFRVDLLVEIPSRLQRQYDNAAFLAIDYKTGYLEQELPVPANKKQILNYINLLSKSTGKKVLGLLIYLDAKKCCLVEGE